MYGLPSFAQTWPQWGHLYTSLLLTCTDRRGRSWFQETTEERLADFWSMRLYGHRRAKARIRRSNASIAVGRQ